jgi:thiol-disulfide isomerase/thioredoxin
MTRTRWAAVAALALFIVTAVWTIQYFRTRERGAPAGADAAKVQLFREPIDVPPFTLTDLDGRSLSSQEWRGKVVLVNFWATWCLPCRVEIPDLVALQDKYRDSLVVVGISEDEEGMVDEVRKFAAEQKVNYPVAMSTAEIRKVFKGVVALPTTFVINQQGQIEQKHVGLLNKDITEAETRVLAGLAPDVAVERVESTEKARLANAAEAKNIPGVDISHFPDDQRKAVLQALIAEECTCGCHLSVAECRLDDPTCSVSLPLAQQIVKQYSAQP